MAMEIWELTATELARALRTREISAVGVLETILDRADRLRHAINPFSVRLDDHAHRAARAADLEIASGLGGPLTGIPVTVKDSQWMAGVESAYGSLTLRGTVPDRTAVAVERLEATGAVIFAKTAVPEFCYTGITESPLVGRTSNPWDLERTPGGSSGGAGAAVAARIGPLSLGGDGGGSIRIPAAFCGIVGYKPTFGAIAREPASAAWKSLVAIGPMARTVADARLMALPLVGMDDRDRYSIDVHGLDAAAPPPRELRVIASPDLGFAPVDDDVRRVFGETVDALRAEGATIIDDNPGLHSSVRPWATIATAEGRYAEARAWDEERDLLTERAEHFLEFGNHVSAAEYIHAQFERDRIHDAYVEMFRRTRAHALLTPTLGCEAFPHGSVHPASIGGVPIGLPWLDWAGFLYDANLCGYPACAIPIGLGDDGLPVSMQVLGLRGWDGRVLAIAETIERVVAFEARPADLTDEQLAMIHTTPVPVEPFELPYAVEALPHGEPPLG
jgi:Asp-tRNA(Asn)/Glu-tRNA(Gln) amidotransferase A subunit family amidase